MKYALALHGMAGGKTDMGNLVSWDGAYPYFQKNVLRPNVDVFCHTWEKDGLDWNKLIDTYKPINALKEPQKAFDAADVEIRSTYSRWYSAFQAVELVPDGYDGILLARYDVDFLVPFPWGKMDTSRFWTSEWRQKPTPKSGYLDYWFYGSPTDMRKVSALHKDMEKWFARGVRRSAHNVIEAAFDDYGITPRISQWGDQPESFILHRRLLGAKN